MRCSIVIPTFNEERYIADALDSIIESCINDEVEIELFVVDGMSDDATQQIVKGYVKRFHFVKLLLNPKKIATTAMNIGVKHSSYENIFIISAHASYSDGYFLKLLKLQEELDAECVGALLVTDVKSKTKKSLSIKEVLSHKFGVGNALFRTGVKELVSVDTVAFGTYKKEVFTRYGLYDENLVRNQDIELNKRIVSGGGKIYLTPDVQATYYARENFISLLKNSYANGKWNILTAYYTQRLDALSLRHFIPLIFLLSLVLPLIGSIIFTPFILLSLLSFGSYFALVIIASLQCKKSENSFIYLVSAFFILHLSYGFGSLVGVALVFKKILKGRK